MLTFLRNLPPQVRPVFFPSPGFDLVLLTGDSWAPVMCSLINHALDRIYLASYSVSTRWPRLATDNYNVYQALLDAPGRGVLCRCVLATHKRTAATSGFNFWASRQLRSAGWRCRLSPRGSLLHMKLLIIDGLFVVVGSHNIAHAAASSNADLSVCITGSRSSSSFISLFNDLYAHAK